MPLEITIRPGKPPKKLSKKKEKELQDLIDDMGKEFPITGKTKKKKKKGKSGLDEYSGGPIPKNKPKKAPPGTKIGPGRKEIPANPHGVDDDTIYLEKGGPVDTPKKKRGNYGPNIGKPFKAMGPVGGLPVNKSGTKIMAGRLAARGYGKAKK